MSTFPASSDNLATTHADGTGEIIHASTINALADAVNAIEAALLNQTIGLTPSGTVGGVDISGTYPNGLTIKNGVVTAAKVGADVATLDSNGLLPLRQSGNGLYRTFESFGGAQNQAVALQTTAWNAYLTWAGANGGGVCCFGPYRYQHLPSLLDIPSYGGVEGTNFSTVLEIDSTATGHGVGNHISSNGTTDPNGIAVSIRDFFLDMSKIDPTHVNGSGVRSLLGTQDGVHIETNPTSGAGGNSTQRFTFNNDQETIVSRVFVWAAPRDCFNFTGKGENNIVDCRAYSAGRYGYKTTFDMNVLGCTTGGSGDHGFEIGTSNRIVGCKAWYSGQLTNGAGFHVFGNSNGQINLTGVEAQDNKGPGYLLDTCAAGVTIIGTADSNSTSGVGSFPAIDIWNCNEVIANINCSDRKNAGTVTQTHALRIRSLSSSNTINIKHKGLNGGVVGTPIDTGSDFTLATTNNITVNGYLGRNPVTFASTITPDPTAGSTIAVTLTGPITIAAPTNGTYWPGCRMKFVLTQDATGGRTITWNGVYKTPPAATTTLSTTTVASFEYDGTNWRLDGFRTGDL